MYLTLGLILWTLLGFLAWWKNFRAKQETMRLSNIIGTLIISAGMGPLTFLVNWLTKLAN